MAPHAVTNWQEGSDTRPGHTGAHGRGKQGRRGKWPAVLPVTRTITAVTWHLESCASKRRMSEKNSSLSSLSLFSCCSRGVWAGPVNHPSSGFCCEAAAEGTIVTFYERDQSRRRRRITIPAARIRTRPSLEASLKLAAASVTCCSNHFPSRDDLCVTVSPESFV